MHPIFEGICGQDTALALLSAGLARQRLAPAYLFVGPEGVGKKLTATRLAEALLGRSPIGHPDVLWVEPTYLEKEKLLTVREAIAQGLRRRGSPQIRIEQVREIAAFVSRAPLVAERLLVMVENAETMAEGAANGLLKTLEEPGLATLILLTPERQRLLPTIVSRCQVVPFYRLDEMTTRTLLQRQRMDEVPAPVLALAQGSPGQALVAWQQYEALTPERLATWEAPPPTPKAALARAREIAQLELDQQVWLVAYLQQRYWERGDREGVARLETVKQQLERYVQPRLVWEMFWWERV
ncbi:MAG: DNA polymerase III subunit delta' [Pseudanabaenaceae cyanobacterium]